MMRTATWIVAGACALAGCSGVEIRPISPDLEREAHQRDGAASGYVVYGPMVVVEIALREVCVAKNDRGACVEQEARCAAGAPFVLPDLAKPFLVDVKNGFGKAGVDLAIGDGWRLGSLKADSDNTAVLGAIEKLALARTGEAAARKAGACRASGLYRVEVDANGAKLAPLLMY
jgi:hypothetical protein